MAATPDPHDKSSPDLMVAATDSAAAAVGAFADVALAPVAGIRSSPWLLRGAMLCLLAAAAAAPWAVWTARHPDWGVYLAGGAATAILAGNFMRWRRRWGWLRRGIFVAAALAVVAVWTALLIDRAAAPSAPGAALLAGSPAFWLPAGLCAGAVVLLLLHYVIDTRRDRAKRA